MTRFTILLTLAIAACMPRPPHPVTPDPAADVELPGPFSIILFIGDGAGVAYWSAAKLGASELAVEAFPIVGLVHTAAYDSRVTDSAAGATAYSAGVRTFNGAIGLGPDSMPVQTVLELARSRRMSTGLVATATVTHATPAAFAAHVPNRSLHYEIARHMTQRDIDVLLGGGKRFFDPAHRPDSADLLSRVTRDAAYIETAAGFRALDMDTVTRLVGFFAENSPGPAIGREPSLPEMTYAALRVLEKNPRGFFLMVEGSQIDWRGHENASLVEVIAETLDFDMAIRNGLHFLERRPNTLIVVVADHSTGGLALHGDEMGVFRAHYTTLGHTAEMVPLFAIGTGAERFGGVKDNYVVGQLLLQMVAEQGPPRRGLRTRTGSSGSWTPSSPSRRP